MHKFFGRMIMTAAVCGLMVGTANADRLILIPTGNTLSTGGLKAQILSRTSSDDGRAYLLNVGVSRLEIEGAKFQDFHGRSEDVISGQVSVLPETSFTPSVALGVRDAGNATEDLGMPYDGRSFYLVASKGIPVTGGIPLLLQNVKLHGGIGTGSLKGLFFGAEGTIPLGLRLAAEYDSSRFNGELSYNIIPKVRASISLIKSDVYYGGSFSTAF